MFTLGLIHFFLELLHGRKDQSWTAVFSRVKTGLKGLGVELLTLVKMLLWAVPGLCCMGIITYLAMTVDSVSRHGLSWMVTLTIVSYAATIIPAVIAYFRYALSMFFLADHPDWRDVYKRQTPPCTITAMAVPCSTTASTAWAWRRTASS